MKLAEIYVQHEEELREAMFELHEQMKLLDQLTLEKEPTEMMFEASEQVEMKNNPRDVLVTAREKPSNLRPKPEPSREKTAREDSPENSGENSADSAAAMLPSTVHLDESEKPTSLGRKKDSREAMTEPSNHVEQLEQLYELRLRASEERVHVYHTGSYVGLRDQVDHVIQLREDTVRRLKLEVEAAAEMREHLSAEQKPQATQYEAENAVENLNQELPTQEKLKQELSKAGLEANLAEKEEKLTEEVAKLMDRLVKAEKLKAEVAELSTAQQMFISPSEQKLEVGVAKFKESMTDSVTLREIEEIEHDAKLLAHQAALAVKPQKYARELIPKYDRQEAGLEMKKENRKSERWGAVKTSEYLEVAEAETEEKYGDPDNTQEETRDFTPDQFEMRSAEEKCVSRQDEEKFTLEVPIVSDLVEVVAHGDQPRVGHYDTFTEGRQSNHGTNTGGHEGFEVKKVRSKLTESEVYEVEESQQNSPWVQKLEIPKSEGVLTKTEQMTISAVGEIMALTRENIGTEVREKELVLAEPNQSFFRRLGEGGCCKQPVSLDYGTATNSSISKSEKFASGLSMASMNLNQYTTISGTLQTTPAEFDPRRDQLVADALQLSHAQYEDLDVAGKLRYGTYVHPVRMYEQVPHELLAVKQLDEVTREAARELGKEQGHENAGSVTLQQDSKSGINEVILTEPKSVGVQPQVQVSQPSLTFAITVRIRANGEVVAANLQQDSKSGDSEVVLTESKFKYKFEFKFKFSGGEPDPK